LDNVCREIPKEYIEKARENGIWVDWVVFPLTGAYVVVENNGRYHVIDIVYDPVHYAVDCEMYWGFENAKDAIKFIERLAGFRVPRKELLELFKLLASQD